MKYSSKSAFINEKNKNILLMGLSGVGKTTICRILPATNWFHYSVDYRIWTHQLGDELNDYLKKLALESPLLKDLLLHDAVTVEHRVSFDNLYATSLFMGMLGSPQHGGSSELEFKKRMAQYEQAEKSAMLDIPYFISRSKELYGYPHFLVDASGSLCEVVNINDSKDAVLKLIEKTCTVVYIEATESHKQELLRRFKSDPKPIYYRPDFLDENMSDLLEAYGAHDVTELKPADISQFLYPRLLNHRTERYKKLSDKLGYTISMSDILNIKTESQLIETIANSIKETSNA